jgi:FkbH-like protein
VTVIGTCIAQFAEQRIHAEALRRGYDWIIRNRWLAAPAMSDGSLGGNDVVVLQCSAQALLEPLFAMEGSAGRLAYAARLGTLIRRWFTEVSRNLREDALLLVHNIAPPQHWPRNGSPAEWRTVFATLNDAIDATVATRSNSRVIDECGIAYRLGAERLFDDALYPWSHHGGRTDAAIDVPNQTDDLGEALATAYLDAFEAHGKPPLKYVFCDLDGVLWPGVLAEDSVGWLGCDTTTRWTHIGIQEALRSLERSGTVLVSISKGDQHVTLPIWETTAGRMPLTPRHFAAHHISWSSKAEVAGEVVEALRTTPANVLFLDDNPVERHLMRTRFPTMTVPEVAPSHMRRLLLSHPRLGPTNMSGVSFSRTESTAASMRRGVAGGEADVLADLGVRHTCRPAGIDDLPRIDDLLSRTTQFTLSSRTGASRLVELQQADPDAVFVMEVADRFVDYGLVGVCAIDRAAGELIAYSVSCRVLGLDVAERLLTYHIAKLGLDLLSVRLRVTDRNGVIRSALAPFGLREVSDGRWTIDLRGIET